MSQDQEARSRKQEVLAVVMARGGSVGLPGKSLRNLLGRAVLAYTLEHARESKLITRTVVSSDDVAILGLAKSEGFETINRPKDLATATSATDPVLRHAVRTLYSRSFETTESTESAGIKGRGNPSSISSIVPSLPHAVVMLYGNVPLRANNMIDRCIQMLFDTDADSVQTIAPVGKFHPYWMFDLNTDTQQIKKHIPNNTFRRQDLPRLYSPTGAVYVMKTSVLMAAEHIKEDPHAFLGKDRRALVVAPEDSVDIDTEKDLYIAEAMLKIQPTETERHEAAKERAEKAT